MPIKKFTFFWLTGHREVFEGETPGDAFKRGGYNMAALQAVDFWAPGDSNLFKWDVGTKKWVKNEEEPVG